MLKGEYFRNRKDVAVDAVGCAIYEWQQDLMDNKGITYSNPEKMDLDDEKSLLDVIKINMVVGINGFQLFLPSAITFFILFFLLLNFGFFVLISNRMKM